MSKRTKNCRRKARDLAHNNKEYILLSRELAGDCLWCSRHDGENEKGSHSKWGKKRAMKNYYATGKTRSLPKSFGHHTAYQADGISNFADEWDTYWKAYYDSDWKTYDSLEKFMREREKMGARLLGEPIIRKFRQ